MDSTELVKVRVSPFEESTGQDSVYGASKSVPSPRFGVAIQELRFAIQAFTASFTRPRLAPTVYENLFRAF